MTRSQLTNILETFAIAVIETTQSEFDPDEQYAGISFCIDKIADTVMLFVERPIPRPSVN